MRPIRDRGSLFRGGGKNFLVRDVQPAKIIDLENCRAQTLEKQLITVTLVPAYIGMSLA